MYLPMSIRVGQQHTAKSFHIVLSVSFTTQWSIAYFSIAWSTFTDCCSFVNFALCTPIYPEIQIQKQQMIHNN